MTEPNKRLLWLGTAIDRTSDGKIKVSAQLAVPSEIGSEGAPKSNAVFVQSAIGSNVFDSVQNLQKQVSRKVYSGHRQAWFIGEQMAKHGLRQWTDEFSRNPESNRRASIFLVKGAEGRDLLTARRPLAQSSTEFAIRANEFSGVDPQMTKLPTFEHHVLAAGLDPLMQVIDVSSEPPRSHEGVGKSKSNLKIHQIALFNDQVKLVGFLKDEEAKDALWVAGYLNQNALTEFMPRGRGTVTLDLQHLSHSLSSRVHHRHIHVLLRLTGTGIIRENNSNLDLTKTQNIAYVERAFDERTREHVEQVITKVQSQYRTDIFGFGENIHEFHPAEWNAMKSTWRTEFPNVEVSVQVSVSVRSVGLKGPSHMTPGRDIIQI